MKTTHRPYSEEVGDFNLLARFTVDHDADIRRYSTWCIGRFVDWKYGVYENKTTVPDFCSRNAQLWFDGFQAVAGFVIAEDGGPGFAIITRAGYRLLFAEMLAWVLQNWGKRGPQLSIEITEQQTLEAGILEQQGFSRTGEFFTQQFDLAQAPAPRHPLEAGFTIVDMATHPDYRSQRILRDDAFSSRRNLAEADLERELLFYNHSHTGPIYHAPTDLCVMAPDGQLVAGCEALIDAHNAAADIERVCTHSNFRQRGFARAVIQECLARLHTLGIRRAYITGYSPAAIALYAALGAGRETRAYIYQDRVRVTWQAG